jgi:hypothetical protein
MNTPTNSEALPLTNCSTCGLQGVFHRLYVGEKIQEGDYWYSKFTGRWIRYDKAPRNLWGFRQRRTEHHAMIVRIVGLKNSLPRLFLLLCFFLVGCGEETPVKTPTERVEGEVTHYQESSWTSPRYTIVKTPEGVVKRVYGRWGEEGEKVIIENAETF